MTKLTQAQIDRAQHEALRCSECGEYNGHCLVNRDGRLQDCPNLIAAPRIAPPKCYA